MSKAVGLRKQPKVNIAETNIANFGSDLEKSIRQASGDHEPAWKTAGKKAGLEVWRVKAFKLQEVPAKLQGTFYSGDSYIVLRTIGTPNSKEFSYDVHFWIGSESSQDEVGTAAYKTVELDDFLGGKPVQHREVDGHESVQFLTYFKDGLRVLSGGFDTGFAHVKPEEYRPRLLQVHGDKKYIAVSEVPLDVKSLNSGDPFILDKGTDIYIWIPSGAQILEKSRVGQVARAISDERPGNQTIHQQEEEGAFWKALGFSGPQTVSPPVAEEKSVEVRKLFKLSDASGKLTFEKIAEGKDVNKAALKSDDVFIVDLGYHVFAWVGKNASAAERKNALQHAQQYLTQRGGNPATPITRIPEGGDHDEFKI